MPLSFFQRRAVPAGAAAQSRMQESIPALTGIRLPLALWVVSHHIAGPGRMLEALTDASPALYAFIDAAWVALSVFFAISGFLLTRAYRSVIWGRQTVTQYAVARFARIYPLYLLSLLLLLALVPETIRREHIGAVDGVGLALNHLLLLQGWHWPSVNWNAPAWSLSCEVFFYACLPLVLPLVRRVSWRRVAATASVACLLPLIMRLVFVEPVPKALLYAGDFLIGVAAAGVFELLAERTGGRHALGPWLVGAAGAAAILLVRYRHALGPFMVFDTGVRLASAALVIGLACGGGWFVRLLSSPMMMAGGRASYAIYILHVPLLWWFRRWQWDTAMGPAAGAIIYVAVVIAMSLAVARWYEEPANRLARRVCGTRLRPSSTGGELTRQWAPSP
jgi:peptidoglycan/LPS O-acetylase OafA/YrhL